MSSAPSVLRLWLMPLLVWFTLLVLLTLTVGSAFVPLGYGNTIINLTIAATKAALIAIFFMELAESSSLVRLASVAGIFWLGFLFALSAGDYLTRHY